MKNSFLKKVYGSVFTKLLVIIIVTGVCMNIMVGVFFGHIYKYLSRTPFQKNIVQYVNYIIDDLGVPPDFERAKKLSEKSSLSISYESPKISWSTTESLSEIDKDHLHIWHRSPDIEIGRYKGHHYATLQRGEGRFTLKIERRRDIEGRIKRMALLLVLILTAMLGVVYLIIRRLLKPVQWLSEGVSEISNGNLEARVPVKSSDELGNLSEAFNDMAENIRDMLQTKERLLLDVSHELRSPITRMRVALEMLPDSTEKGNLHEDILELEKLVSEILETARLHNVYGRPDKKVVNLPKLIYDILPLFDNQPPGVKVKKLPGTPEILIDPKQIKIVLINILNNAIKYSGKSDDPVMVSMSRTPSYVVIRVKDTGIGIPDEELPYIFEPFYRVDKARSKETGGYGLGLSLCKTIMEAHGGKIVIDSKADQGTTVILKFPATIENSDL